MLSILKDKRTIEQLILKDQSVYKIGKIDCILPYLDIDTLWFAIYINGFLASRVSAKCVKSVEYEVPKKHKKE